MENSLSSCINKAVASKGTTNSPEESGWTAYFEDFSSYEGHSSSNSSFHTSSGVSDAASSAAWKNPNSNLKIPKRLSFKKTRTKIISLDDSLEDTASSPVSSPKVGDLEPGDMNPRKAHDHHIISSLSKADNLYHYPELQADDERREIMNFGGKNNHDYTDLRKRGLCLVPLSKLVNYFG
ncbi:vascular-related unknown protein 1-like isoform X1 [Juglans regia]|uniref:Uncharacterized protein n=1 Tax=Juglans regia TaxID=51240 RepID=A0A6P9DT15_JUGRE|nr:vascular-related unknown protein 1-like isoform X1 [Juglans regia]XP_035538580.1 vascular-related unknown protein 1-like isoform X1 [Juglans regia]